MHLDVCKIEMSVFYQYNTYLLKEKLVFSLDTSFFHLCAFVNHEYVYMCDANAKTESANVFNFISFVFESSYHLRYPSLRF